jgi:hypothetical protein
MVQITISTSTTYPWAAPTVQQKAEFDSLSPAAKQALLDAAVEEGFASGISDKSLEEILAAARADTQRAL